MSACSRTPEKEIITIPTVVDNVKLDATSLLPGDDSDLKERILFLEKSLSEAKDKFVINKKEIIKINFFILL